MKLILIGCGAKKLPYAALARDLYTGPLFKDRRAYAERSGLPWYILSGLHGVISPNQLVEPYDYRLPTWSARNNIGHLQWAKSCLRKLRCIAGSDEESIEAEIHAGMDYVAPFAYLVRLSKHRSDGNEGIAHGFTFTHPVAGLSQGEQRAWYRNP